MTRILHQLSLIVPQETANKCETSIHKMVNVISFWDIIYLLLKLLLNNRLCKLK